MSPDIKTNSLQPYSFFPPARGVVATFPNFAGNTTVPALGQNPLIPGPPMSLARMAAMSETQINLAYGRSVLGSAVSNSDLFKTLTSFKDASNSDLIAAIKLNSTGATELYYIPIGTGVLTNVATIEAATADNNRIAWSRFRNRILLGTHLDGLRWYNPAAHTTRKAGVIAPTTNLASAVGAAGVLTGAYLYVYTNVNDQGHESDPSAVSTVVNPVVQQVNLTSIDVGPTGTSSRRVYRTTNGGATYLFLTTIADNVTTTYTDNIADTALGSAVITDNTLPIDTIAHMAVSANRVALLSTDGLKVYFSKIDASTGEPNWEAFPTALSVDIPFSGGIDAGRAIVYFEDAFYVFGGLTTYRIIGDIAQGPKVEKIFPFGINATYSFAEIAGQGLALITNQKRIYLISDGEINDIGAEIQGRLDSAFSTIPNAGQAAASQFSFEYLAKINALMFYSSDYNGTYNFKTKQWIASPITSTVTVWPIMYTGIVHYSEIFQALYGVNASNRNIYADSGDFSIDTAYTTAGMWIEYYPWTPFTGYDTEFGWIEILMEGKPIVSSVVPMLKVSYALDGAATNDNTASYTSKFADYSRDFIIKRMSPDSSVLRTLRVPVHSVGRTLKLKIETVANTASLAKGVEIYAIRVWCRPLREAREGRNVPR